MLWFRRSRYARKVREAFQQAFGLCSHQLIRLNSKDSIAVFEEDLRKQPGAGSNVCDY